MCLSNWLTNQVEHSPSTEANRFSGSQQILHIFVETQSSLPHSQEPATCPCPWATLIQYMPPIPILEDPF